MGYYNGLSPAFTVGTPGVPLQTEVPTGFAATATNFGFVFEGLNTNTRLRVTATPGTSDNGNPCLSYTTTGADFLVPDVYLWEVEYLPNGNALTATDVPPFGQLVVAERL